MTVPDPASPDGPGRRVLVVEDEPELLGVLEGLLRDQGFAVTRAADGVEALRAVMEEDFDAILCDLVMPRMPGDMFYAAVGRVKPYLCDRFLFITAHSQAPKTRDFLIRTTGTVLRKPFHWQDLLEVLTGILRDRGRASPAGGPLPADPAGDSASRPPVRED